MILPDDCYLDAHQLITVEKHAARLLLDSAALNVFPTPVDRIMETAHLVVVDDELLDEHILAQFMRKAKSTITTVKSALSKILALIHIADNLVLIDKNVPAIKLPFVKLHEAGHGTLPHQKKAYSLVQECEKTLDPDVTDLFEREANVFASEVLFQGSLFGEEAHQSAFGIKVPIALAKKYGASNYAAFRRYVSTSPSPCCVIVLEPVIMGIENHFTANIRRIIATKSFHAIYDEKTFGSVLSKSHLLGHLVPIHGKRMTGSRKIKLTDRNKDIRNCTAEAFNTTHHIFLLIKDVGLHTTSTILMPSNKWVSSFPHVSD